MDLERQPLTISVVFVEKKNWQRSEKGSFTDSHFLQTILRTWFVPAFLRCHFRSLVHSPSCSGFISSVRFLGRALVRCHAVFIGPD
jgi:hypothetical protein